MKILIPLASIILNEFTTLSFYIFNNTFLILVPYISNIMFHLLRSLVKAYQLCETTCLCTIESDFTPHLTSEQRHLLSVLINTLI